jgi:hypothetical protein
MLFVVKSPLTGQTAGGLTQRVPTQAPEALQVPSSHTLPPLGQEAQAAPGVQALASLARANAIRRIAATEENDNVNFMVDIWAMLSIWRNCSSIDLLYKFGLHKNSIVYQ